ncbi:MAG: hypothetical protein WD627_02845 [Actinomycetota bacterium]
MSRTTVLIDEQQIDPLGSRRNQPLSNMSMLKCLRTIRSETDEIVHGFRSSFRDWAAEQTDYPREVVEACLAHATGGAVELAYRRTDFLEKRRELMAEWGGWCCAG